MGVLLVVFGWSARNPRRPTSAPPLAGVFDECGCRHIACLSQMRQVFSNSDYEFLTNNAPLAVLRRVRRERRSVALAYLAALREDFHSLLRTARVIAVLSPELDAVHEFERLRLTAKFAFQYHMIRWKLLAGVAPVPPLNGMSELVTGVSVRIEAAMKE